MDKEQILLNIDKLHSTELGIIRIRKNLHLANEDVINYCRKVILNEECFICKKGKNFYCELDNISLLLIQKVIQLSQVIF